MHEYKSFGIESGQDLSKEMCCRQTKGNLWACLGVPCGDCMFGDHATDDGSFDKWNEVPKVLPLKPCLSSMISMDVNDSNVTSEHHVWYDLEEPEVSFWDLVIDSGGATRYKGKIIELLLTVNCEVVHKATLGVKR